MRRKQVMAMLLAISMAAVNVAVMPAEAQAKIAVKPETGAVDENEGTIVKLTADVNEGDKIYIHSDDVKDSATVTVAVDGETYEKIIYAAEKPTDQTVSFGEDATGSVTLDATNGFADNATSATLYLLKKDASDLTTDGNMISVTVEIDSTEPALSTLTVGGKDAKDAAATVAETELELVLEAGSDDSGDVAIAYAAGTAEWADEKAEAQAWTSYDAEQGAKITLAEGSNYVYVRLTDAVGNVAYVGSKEITVDTAAPSCTFKVSGATKIDGTENAYNIDTTDATVGITLESGDELTKVTVDGTEDSNAKDNKSVTLNKAGEHTIIVDLKHTANAKTATQSAVIKCYKKVGVSAKSAVTKTYGDTYGVADLYTLTDTGYQGTPTTKYVVEDGETVKDEDSAKTALTSGGTAGLPTDAGTYWVQTTFPANDYFLENSVYTKLTINQKAGVTAAYNGTVTVQASDDATGTTVDLAEAVAQYKSDGDALEYTAGSVTGDGSSNITVEITTGTSELVVKGTGTAVDADKDATIPVTVTGFTNYDSITVNVPVKVTKNAVANLVINAVDKTYDGTALAFTCQVDGASIEAGDKLTIKVNDASYAEDSMIDAATYTIKAEYTDDEKTGYATKTVIVSKRALKVKFADTTVTEGTAADAVAYPTAPVYDGLATGQTAATKAAITLTSGYTADAKANAKFEYTGTPDASKFQVTGANDADVTANYEITVENGFVVVKAASTPSDPSTPSTPSGPSSPSAPSGPSTPATPAEKPGDGQTTTDTITITTNDEGETVIVNAGGETIRNDVVKIDGEKYITDEDGVVITDEFATTPSGSLVYADADGKLVTDQIFTVSGTKYVAKKSGALATDEFVKTDKGNTIYCKESGAVVTSQIFTVSGKKYVAKKSGALVVSGFAKTNHGSTVYCGKSGAVVRNKAFTVSGKKYVAKKSGALVKNAWVKVGNKKYYCGKNGVVTKTKKAN